MYFWKIISFACCKPTLPWFLWWFVAKTTTFIPIWKVSRNNLTLFEDLSMIYMILFLHINTPWINGIVLFVVAHVALICYIGTNNHM